MASLPRTYRLIVSCPDRLGIVAAVSSFLAQHGGWIIEASQHADALAGWFFMRYEILAESLTCEVAQLQQEFEPIARDFQDVEKTFLARGLRYHLEDRVLIHGNKTVILE